MALQLIALKADVNAADYAGTTPLMVAAEQVDFDLVKNLVAAGANPNAARSDPLDARKAADAVGHVEISAWLRQRDKASAASH